MQQRITLQPTFILHSRHYGDTSLILEAFTRDYGRMTLVAKGYRKKRQHDAKPFSLLLVSWTGRGEMKTLTAAESSNTCALPAGRQLYAALYVNEVLQRLLPKNDAHPTLFDYYCQLIPNLAVQQDFEPQLRQFELQLLSELGYALDLRCNASDGGAIEPRTYYRYVSEAGFFPDSGNQANNRESFLGEDLLAIGAGDFSTLEVRRAAKRLSRLALAPLLGGRPLKSRELFYQIPLR